MQATAQGEPRGALTLAARGSGIAAGPELPVAARPEPRVAAGPELRVAVRPELREPVRMADRALVVRSPWGRVEAVLAAVPESPWRHRSAPSQARTGARNFLEEHSETTERRSLRTAP